MTRIPDIAELTILRGERAPEGTQPSLLIELPHGATRARHFAATRAVLHGSFPDDLDHFFFVNTDVGSPELGRSVAEAYLKHFPTRTAALLCSEIPRTFIDCNRVIQPGQRQASPTDITPGLPPYVRDARDKALLVERHAQYQQLADTWTEQVCAAGGFVVMMHTYAPRSVGVTVDDDIVAKLHGAYEPEVFETWPLRPEVDVICRDLDGTLQAPEALLRDLVARYRAEGVAAGLGETYPLHPVTTAAQRALRHPQQTLCVEVRRDLVVSPFTPFAEMIPDPAMVARMAAPIAAALCAHHSAM